MALSDSPKTEKINGAIYSMSPSADYRHSIINLNIYSVLRQKLKGSLCMVFCENLDFVLDETGNYAIPDIMVICDRKQLKKGQYYGIPWFITETLSPSTAARDKQEKKKIYAEKGVDEYWIMTRTVNPITPSRKLPCTLFPISAYVLKKSSRTPFWMCRELPVNVRSAVTVPRVIFYGQPSADG